METNINSKKKINFFDIIIIAAVIVGIVWVGSKFIHLGSVIHTNNAQVRQHITPINSRVQGFVKEICFEEFQPVKKGDTLVIIEDTEFRLRVAQAESDLQNALQGRNVAGTSVSAARNNVGVSDASISEVEVLLNNAKTELVRYENLLEKGAVTRQQYDGIKTSYDATLAKYNTLKRQRESTSLMSNEQAQRLEQQDAIVDLAKVALELSQLNLSYTVILATADGVTGRKTIQEGQLIQPGQAVVSIVESNNKWVIANYKETQMAHIGEGSVVDIKVDAIKGVKFKGVVRSISEATGSAYSMVPTDNSAGNFVKVEQRIPVRIEFSNENRAEDMKRLRSGMNVECKVKY